MIRATSLLYVVLLAGVLLPANAQKNAVDPVSEYYTQSDTAFKKKDARGLLAQFDRFTASTFTSKGVDGDTITREEARATFGATFNGIGQITERKTDFSSQEKTPSRIVVHLKRTEQYATTDIAGLYGPKGQTHLLKITTVAEHVWIKVNGQLKLNYAETKDRRVNVDGVNQ